MRTGGWWLMPMAVLLFGCGGGGGGSSSGSGAAAPTYATIPTLSSKTTFATVAVASTYNRQPNASTPTIGAVAATVTAALDPTSTTYSLTGMLAGSTTQASQTFGPAALQNGSYSIVSVTSDGTTLFDRFSVGQSLAAAPGGAATTYSYTGWGQWQNGSTTSAFLQTSNTYVFAYGIETQAGDLPRTGTATYPLLLTGYFDPGFVVGVGTLTANFAAGTVSVSVSPGVNDANNGDGPVSFPPVDTLTGSGTINFTTNSFNFTLTGSQYSGPVNGLFYGPQGAEVGAAFDITATNGVSAAGAALGKKS